MYSVVSQVGSVLPVPGSWRVVSSPVGQTSVTSPISCGFTNVGETLRKNQRSLRAHRVALTRGVTYSKYSSIGALITPFRERRSSFSTPSPSLSPQVLLRVEPRWRALSVGRYGELLAICRRFLDRLTDRDPRVAGRTNESRARRVHAAQCHSHRGEISSNRRVARRPPETGAVTLARGCLF